MSKYLPSAAAFAVSFGFACVASLASHHIDDWPVTHTPIILFSVTASVALMFAAALLVVRATVGGFDDE